MAETAKQTTLLVLGAAGRLGTLLRAHWARHAAPGARIWFQARSPLPGTDTLHWAPGQPDAALPHCDSVVALWGRTTGGAGDLAENSALADQSRAVALASGASRLFHLSSAAVYGPSDGATEDDPPNPVSDYGRSKRAMEARVARFDDPGLRHCCLRLANVVGADSLAPALAGRGAVTLDRFADGRGPQRSYIGAADLAAVLLSLARVPAPRLPALLNIALPRPVAMEDLARAAQKRIVWQAAPDRAVQTVTMDCTRMTRLLPDLSLSASPEHLIAAWRAQRDGA